MPSPTLVTDGTFVRVDLGVPRFSLTLRISRAKFYLTRSCFLAAPADCGTFIREACYAGSNLEKEVSNGFKHSPARSLSSGNA